MVWRVSHLAPRLGGGLFAEVVIRHGGDVGTEGKLVQAAAGTIEVAKW